MKPFWRSPAGKTRPTPNDDDMTLHLDDATTLTAQAPTSPVNHADFVAVAEQQAIADASRPVHDADSLSTGSRELAYLSRLDSWGQVKASEATIRANDDYLNQQSIIGAIEACSRQQRRAQERTAQAEAEAQEAKAVCVAGVGASATARVEQGGYAFRRYVVMGLVALAFAGEIQLNYLGLSFFALSALETYVIAVAVAIILFAGAGQVVHAFQDRNPAKWVALVGFLSVLVSVAIMLTVLREAAVTLSTTDVSGLGPSGAASPSGPTLLRVSSFVGLTAMQIAFPLTIALIELLDSPEAKAYHQALRRLAKAKRKEQLLESKHPDLPERMEVARMRARSAQERPELERDLIDRVVEDAQDTYVCTYLQASGSPEVTTAMDIRLDATERRASQAER